MTDGPSLVDIVAGLGARRVEAAMLEAADAAAAETLPRFRTRMVVDNKLGYGFDPVTEADRAAETALRDVLARHFPDHAIVGEEWEPKLADSDFEWIVDPIDGTRAFISGAPVWGTLIGLTHRGRAVAGLMSQPFTGELFFALPGRAVLRRHGDEQPLATSGVTEMANAKLSATSPDLFLTPDTASVWDAVRAATLQTRYGLDCYAYCLLAAGHLDIVCEAMLKDVDIAPLIPVIENAGGVVTTWDGGPAEQGGNCVATATPKLHEAALAVIAGARR
jgi:histidinol phosphatase-like enzyme (inositol monophosphatase family)